MKLLTNKTVQNAGWLLSGRIIHIILSFVIGLLTARFLGPSNYGLINYVAAYTTFFTAFCTLGINSVIVKHFIDHPTEEGETIGTAMTLRLISSVLSLGAILCVVRVVDGYEPVTLTVAALYCLGLVFGVADTINYWFQSRLQSKYYAIATTVAYVITSLYRIALLVTGKSVEWFAAANALDFGLVAVFLLLFYKKKQGPRFSFSFRKAKVLLGESYSYILSGLMVAIYGATDKIMIKQMLDESSVGYYALALSISTIWTFVLAAIIDSLKPTIMRYHNENKAAYTRMNINLYSLVFYFSLATSLCIALIAPFFIRIVYGDAYLPALSPLRVVIWYVAFSYLGVARDIWIVCERKQKYLKYLYIGAALCNIVLNVILIPSLGTVGAAVASVFTQISTIFIFPLFIKDLRPNVRLMLDAIKLKGLIK